MYHSSHAQGYLSTIHLQLTPSDIPETLRLVHLRIVVEGFLVETTFEADPDIKYTFAWNKRNVYKQKVYGLTTARGKYFLYLSNRLSTKYYPQLTFYRLEADY